MASPQQGPTLYQRGARAPGRRDCPETGYPSGVLFPGVQALFLFAAAVVAAAQAAGTPAHPFDVEQAAAFPEEFVVFVEIPAEGRVKYEVNPENGRVEVDRFLQTPMRYPANYGSVPGTLAGDGDPLDALVFTREPLVPGVLIRARPLALLPTMDGGEEDAKLIAVPARDVDPGLAAVETLEDLGALEGERVLMFFREYKRIPAGAVVEVGDFQDADTARRALSTSRQRYREARSRRR